MSPPLILLFLSAAFASVGVAGGVDLARLPAGELRGVSWSDPRDNYNTAQIIPSGLSLGDTPETAARLADQYAARAAAVGVNVVRLGINPPTVADARWWPTYERLIRTLAARGMGVILCAWEQSPTVQQHGRHQHNGRFGEGTVASYASMWQTVHRSFANEANVIGYELLNEPFGYRKDRDAYMRDMRTLMQAIGPDLGGKHILIAGLGYSDNIQAIASAFPEPYVWFAYHVYPNWFGGEAGDTVFTRQRYADEIARQVRGLESRTVITEFGCWGGSGFDYAKPAADQESLTAKRHVAYLQGVADACERLHLGSIYWFADARESPAHRAYDLFSRDGSVLDPDRLKQIQRGWRLLPAD
ncbi:MAG: cellulase family glycosylhydrolase [Tepidisphaeraceae bacterium]